jgi:hypothetical protein
VLDLVHTDDLAFFVSSEVQARDFVDDLHAEQQSEPSAINST